MTAYQWARVGAVAAACLQISCATIFLHFAIEDQAKPNQEIERAACDSISGRYGGTTTENSQEYFTILIPACAKTCRSKGSIELLLPKASAGKPGLLRESKREPTAAEPEVLIFGSNGWQSCRKPEAPMSAAACVDGRPGIVTVEFLRTELGVRYCDPSKDAEAQVAWVDLTPLSWSCRSRVLFLAMHLLYVPAVVFDIITFPVQYFLLKDMPL